MKTKVLTYPKDKMLITAIIQSITDCYMRILTNFIDSGAVIVTFSDNDIYNDLPSKVRKVIESDDTMEFEFSMGLHGDKKNQFEKRVDVLYIFNKNGVFHCQYHAKEKNDKDVIEAYTINFKDLVPERKSSKMFNRESMNELYKRFWNMFAGLVYTGYLDEQLEECEVDDIEHAFTKKELYGCAFNLGQFDVTTN